MRKSAALALLAILVTGCAKSEPDNLTVILGVDLSDSTLSHRSDYSQYHQMILDSLRPGDTLLVSVIKSHPADGSVLALPATELKTPETAGPEGGNSTMLGLMNDKIRKEAASGFRALIEQEYEETPIVDLLNMIPRLYAHYPASRRSLVLLSDMQEYSRGGLNLANSSIALTEESLEAALAELQSEGRVPDLSGVRVYVAGARDADIERLNALRGFWTDYFNATGALLDPNDYGPELIRF